MRRIRYSVAILTPNSTPRSWGARATSKRKDIWLWGGGELFGSLAAAGLVDTVEVGIIPVLLGAGRKVMAGCNERIKLVPRPTELELPGHTLLVYDVQRGASRAAATQERQR